MAGVALNDATVADSTSTNHIRYRRWEFTGSYTPPTGVDRNGNPIGGGSPIYDWYYYNTNATVKGKCNASSNNVYINGKNAVLSGDKTTENDEYTIPSGGEYVSGAHSSVDGSVISGNGRNVYIGGKSVAVNGSEVTTHATTNTTINQGSSNVNIG